MLAAARRLAARPLRCAMLACALAGSAHGPAYSQARGFDGTWLVVITCPAARDGAGAYTLRFFVAVRDGVLHGETGVRGQAASLSLDGAIQPDGDALLSARGMTGNPDVTLGRLTPGTPYAYQMRTRFAGAHGAGTRVEARPCDAVFTRQ